MPNKAFTSISLGSEMKEWFRVRCKDNNWTYDQGMEDYKLKLLQIEQFRNEYLNKMDTLPPKDFGAFVRKEQNPEKGKSLNE